MLTHILQAVSRKRDGSDRGFTLIELLVVVIIIGILAAIAIPVYLSAQNNAKDSAVESDIANAKTAVIAAETKDGSLPQSLGSLEGYAPPTANDSAYAAAADFPTLTPNGTTGFCIGATSVSGTTFAASDSSGVVKGATCSATGVLTTTPPAN